MVLVMDGPGAVGLGGLVQDLGEKSGTKILQGVQRGVGSGAGLAEWEAVELRIAAVQGLGVGGERCVRCILSGSGLSR